MTTLRPAAQQALEACKLIVSAFDALKPASAARNEPLQINAARASITALEAALAEPVQEEEGLIEFLADLQRSRMKYPNNRRMFDGLMSEVDELRRAYAGDGDIRAEAFDVAVCAFRIATEGDSGGNTTLKQAEPMQEPATLPGPGLVMCPACCAQFDPALNSVKPVREPDSPERRCGGPGCDMKCCQPVAQRGAMFHTHPAVERQRSVEAAVRPACGVDPAAKAQPVQEPVAIADGTFNHDCPIGTLLYTAPPQRKPLPASEIVTMYDESPRGDSDMIAFARAIERAHGIGGSDE